MAGWDYKEVKTETGARVAVLIPHRDEKDVRAWRIWWDRLNKDGCTWFEQRGFSLTTNRTQLVRLALANKDITHVFFLDDDVMCPDNIIPTLISAGLPIVCGLYMAKKKSAERGLAAWMWVEKSETEKGYMPITPEQPGRFMEVDVTGLGCAMIHRSVFERVPEPWFVWEPPPAPSEDFFFFDKVSKALKVDGKPLKPVIDMTMKCNHIGLFVLDCDGKFETPEI